MSTTHWIVYFVIDAVLSLSLMGLALKLVWRYERLSNICMGLGWVVWLFYWIGWAYMVYNIN